MGRGVGCARGPARKVDRARPPGQEARRAPFRGPVGRSRSWTRGPSGADRPESRHVGGVMKKLIAAVLVVAGAAACDGGPTEPDTVTEDRGYSLRLESREVRKPANVSVLFQVRTSAGKPVPGLAVEDF